LALTERDVVLHSWCVQADWSAPTVVGGRGAKLKLADGREILDLSSLAECSNLGHQHPRVVAAIRDQAERLCFVTSAWGAEPRAALARRLLELPGSRRPRFFRRRRGSAAHNEDRSPDADSTGLVVTRDRSYRAGYWRWRVSEYHGPRRPEALGVRRGAPPMRTGAPFQRQQSRMRTPLTAADCIDLRKRARRR
jgi:taurine--2-oxoglutarate transaminase